MDLVEFFRMGIAVTLAVVSVGLVLTINVIFIGNAYYMLRKCFKKEKILIEIGEEKNKKISLPVQKSENSKKILPKAS